MSPVCPESPGRGCRVTWTLSPLCLSDPQCQDSRCVSPLRSGAPAPLCQGWAALMDSNLNFRIIQVVIKMGQLSVQGSSILFDLENSASVSELQFLCTALLVFFLSSPSILSLKDQELREEIDALVWGKQPWEALSILSGS